MSSDIIMGIIIPAVVFGFSYYMTHLLYRHFAGEDVSSQKENRDN